MVGVMIMMNLDYCFANLSALSFLILKMKITRGSHLNTLE